MGRRASGIARRRAEEERAEHAFRFASDDEVGGFERDARVDTDNMCVDLDSYILRHGQEWDRLAELTAKRTDLTLSLIHI